MTQLSRYPHLKWYVSNLKSIPGGYYRWGASPSRNESGTKITMSPFRIGATPVTWGMWKEYRQTFAVPGKGVKLPADSGWGYPDDHPVVNVSWEDIMDPAGFCKWASKLAGFKFSLPSDAQWEYAARGGTDGQDYPWGNEFDRNRLWCSKETFEDARRTAAVDRATRIYRNAYGLTDMVGNVWEWCSDYMDTNYRPFGKDPVDGKKSDYRCVRGGSWQNTNPLLFQCAYRNWSYIDTQYNEHLYGFRLVAPPK